ncbi:Cilia- and flagella-associated protein 53 [Quaeritorhiza haematococci]|nr:Cilia- and flagella-associated protein 53 [Quaeritorhiza haematococci]
MLEQTQYYAQTTAKSQFEDLTTKAIERNRFHRRFGELKRVVESELEERREKLRQLLAEDDLRYSQELLAQQETKESRIEAMKARVAELKAKREAERKAIAEEKLMQKWRNECDELRAVESKLVAQEIAAARGEQLVEHQQKQLRALEEKKIFDELWEMDRQRKIAREEEEESRRKALNQDMVLTLDSQLASLRLAHTEETRLKQEEALLMRQQAELLALEEERLKLRKIQDQALLRAELDRFSRLKMQQRAQALKESLEMDMKIVNGFFRDDEADRRDQTRKREELRREMGVYREQLVEQQRVEKEREREMERAYMKESEKMWQARVDKWQKEQKARDRLMQEVLAGRQEQLRFAMEQNKLRQQRTRLEKESLQRQIAHAKAQEEAHKAELAKRMEGYKRVLEEQIEGGERRRGEERGRREVEREVQKEADLRYQELLRQETERLMSASRYRMQQYRSVNRPA